jgi:hypothetical protein
VRLVADLLGLHRTAAVAARGDARGASALARPARRPSRRPALVADSARLEAADEVAHLRIDLLAPASAREDAVVAAPSTS